MIRRIWTNVHAEEYAQLRTYNYNDAHTNEERSV